MKAFVFAAAKTRRHIFMMRLLTFEDTVEFFNLVSGFEVGSRGESSPRRPHAGALKRARAES
jgi:hypothetical protein